MAISVNIPTTATQDARLANMLSQVNAQRTANGQTTYADMNALCTQIIIDQITDWVQSQNAMIASTVANAYSNATQTQQNQVKTILGL
jgi:hypothetical protein